MCLINVAYGCVFIEQEVAGGQGEEGAGGGGHEANQTWSTARAWPWCGPQKFLAQNFFGKDCIGLPSTRLVTGKNITKHTLASVVTPWKTLV